MYEEFSVSNMDKKLLSGFLLFFLSVVVFAQTGLKIFVEDNGGELTIVKSRGKIKELIIPETINDKPVTIIGEGAFTRKGLTKVTIPDSVTEIGEGPFSYNELSILKIGNNVETIGQKAFYNNKLDDLTIGAGVKSIGMGAFANNELTKIDIPDSVTSIQPYAFFFNKLKIITIPDNVTAIGEGAFSSNHIYSVVIGGSVEEIGNGAFFNNRLTSITIPGSVTAMGKRVFESRITKKGSELPVDYVDETGEVIFTTANNFDTFYASTGMRAGKYSYSREGWSIEE